MNDRESSQGACDLDSETFAVLLTQARKGSEDAAGQLLERCRPYLLLIANEELESRFRGKVGASDLVQESIISARRCLGDFEGTSQEELLAWMRAFLLNDLHRTRRHYQTQSRQVDRECRQNANSSEAQEFPDQTTQTPDSEAVTREEQAALAEALARMDEDDQTVIQLRNWERLSFVEIGERMERTTEAARKLWSRAILRLKKTMGSQHESNSDREE